jgi:hypothetical protein
MQGIFIKKHSCLLANHPTKVKPLKIERAKGIDMLTFEKDVDEDLARKKDSSITYVEKENNMCKMKLIAKV